MFVSLTLLPEITPFEASQIGFTWRRMMLGQKLQSSAQVITRCGQGLLGQIDIGHVFILPGQSPLPLGSGALAFGLMPERGFGHLATTGLMFSSRRADC